MCKIVKSGPLCPRRQNLVLSAAKEVSLPELLLPLSATQDADKDTSEVITGALMLHGIKTDEEISRQATTLHVRLCSTVDSIKEFTTSRARANINFICKGPKERKKERKKENHYIDRPRTKKSLPM
jgi:hypothetical protein